jgi:hypothetical protein
MWRVLPFFVAVLALALPTVSARAQAPYVDDRFPHLFAPRDQRPRLFSIPQQTRPVAPRAATRPAESTRPPRESASAPTSPTQPQTPGAEAETAPTTFVLVLGDNLAEWLAYGLEEAFEDVPELGVTDRSKLTSGLVRPEFHDWAKAIPDILAREAKVDFIVMMLGSNDRQAIRIDREAAEPGTDRWRELYAQRVDAAMQAMKARGVPVYWVGLPPLRGQRTSTHMAQLNEIYKERAQKNGVTYIDVWNGFVDEHGNYTQFGPDFAGQVRRLRTNDGVHFTVAGARKLALFLEQDLRRDLLGRITPVIPPGATDQPSTPQPASPEAALPGAPAPAPPRPLAGPILPLAGNPTIPRPAGGTAAPESATPAPVRELAGSRVTAPAQGAAAAVLVRGDAPAAVPGRADDFRWPRRPASPAAADNAIRPPSASASGTVPR